MTYGINSFGLGSYGAPPESAAGSSVTLVIQDMTTAQTLEAVLLSANGAADLVIQDIAQAQTIDNLALSVIPVVDLKIGIGVADSNGSGRGSFSQTLSATDAWLLLKDMSIAPLTDPWDRAPNTYSALDDTTNAAGSFIPRLADLVSATGKSTLWVPAAHGGSQSSGWTSTAGGTRYAAMKDRFNAVGGVDVIIMLMGANDAISAVSQATYVANMNTIIANLVADFPAAKIYLQKVHHNSSATTENIDNIRAGVEEIWNGSSGCRRGADLEGISTGVHYGQTGNTTTCTAELNEVALRTFNAVFGADLVIADITQAQTIDSPAPSAGYALSIADIFQASQIENVALYNDGALNLQVADITQAQTIDQISLSSDAWLSIADMTQASRIDNVLLSLPGLYVRAPAGGGPSIIRPVGQRPPNTGGQRI